MTGGRQIVVPDSLSSEALPCSSLNSNPPESTHQRIVRERGHNPLRRNGAAAMYPSNHYPLVPTAIIDMNALYRAGLIHILARSRFRVIACCSQLPDLSKSAIGDKRAVALIGFDNDVGGILSAIPSLKGRHTGLRIIILCNRLQPDQVLDVMEAGADGCLLVSELSCDVLLRSLELVLVQGVVIPQGFTKLLNGRAQPESAPAVQLLEATPESGRPPPVSRTHSDNLVRLSNREQAILMHLTQGASNKHIARELDITEATVKVHVKGVLRKIRVHNRTQAAMWAISNLEPNERQALQSVD